MLLQLFISEVDAELLKAVKKAQNQSIISFLFKKNFSLVILYLTAKHLPSPSLFMPLYTQRNKNFFLQVYNKHVKIMVAYLLH